MKWLDKIILKEKVTDPLEQEALEGEDAKRHLNKLEARKEELIKKIQEMLNELQETIDEIDD
jgi:predicted transcriptional regulator